MASRKVKKPKKRAQRATSNVFAMFAQDQIQVQSSLLSFIQPSPRQISSGPSWRPELPGSYQADRRNTGLNNI